MIVAGSAAVAAEISIDLPAGFAAGELRVGLEGDGVSLVLPEGTVVPQDLVARSGGAIRQVSVEPGDSGSVRVRLFLDRGNLEEVVIADQRLTLVFRGGVAPSAEEITDFRLGPDDKIQVAVSGHPDLTQQVVVKRNGRITAPLVGEVEAAGLTVQSLGARLEELLGRDYLVDPRVDVEVVEFNSQWVLVTGEVGRPGRIALRGGTNLKEVIAEAGGLTEQAGNRIVVSRDDASATAPLTVDRRKFEAGEANPRLAHGTIVNVPEAAFCYVQGEVRNPGKVKIEAGMTVLRAIAVAGGLTEWADRKEVRVLREGEASHAQVVNLKRVVEQKDPDPELAGGEVVVVGRRVL
jgi:polysaccharide export outer membrane protein